MVLPAAQSTSKGSQTRAAWLRRIRGKFLAKKSTAAITNSPKDAL
jgi:hypothetical protein